MDENDVIRVLIENENAYILRRGVFGVLESIGEYGVNNGAQGYIL